MLRYAIQFFPQIRKLLFFNRAPCRFPGLAPGSWDPGPGCGSYSDWHCWDPVQVLGFSVRVLAWALALVAGLGSWPEAWHLNFCMRTTVVYR